MEGACTFTSADGARIKPHVVFSNYRADWEAKTVGALWRWQERVMTYLAHLASHQSNTPAFAAGVQNWKASDTTQTSSQNAALLSVDTSANDLTVVNETLTFRRSAKKTGLPREPGRLL